MTPDDWEPALFRKQAQYWREQAQKLPPSDRQAVCLEIAEGYDRLARIIEKRQASDPTSPLVQDAPDQC